MRFLISVPDALHKKLKAASKESGQTLCGYVRGILWDWMEKQPKEQKGEKGA